MSGHPVLRLSSRLVKSPTPDSLTNMRCEEFFTDIKGRKAFRVTQARNPRAARPSPRAACHLSRRLRRVSFTNPFTKSTPTSARSESTVSRWSAIQPDPHIAEHHVYRLRIGPAKPETRISGDAELLDLAVDRGA